MRALKRFSASVAALLLSGCLVSDEPLFDAASGSAAALSSGRYQACETPATNAPDECNFIDVTRRDDGAYDFVIVEEDAITVRFHEIGPAAYAAQFEDDDGDGFQYYWAARDGAALTLTMIWCEDLPADLRNALKKDGAIAFEDGSSTCTALNADGVVRAAIAYRDGAAKPDSAVRLTPAP